MGKRGVIHPVYGTTEAAFFGKIRSALRKMWSYSKPYKDALSRSKVPYLTPGHRKYSIQCERCHSKYAIGERIVTGETKLGKEKTSLAYAVHHKIETGTLKSFEDISIFAEKLFCAPEGLLILCWECHRKSHKEE
jgi:hypothetical protein